MFSYSERGVFFLYTQITFYSERGVFFIQRDNFPTANSTETALK